MFTYIISLIFRIHTHRFLDKMYSMSTSEALTQFMMNPRMYLNPPNPQIPCKICVLGPPFSGKSTLAKAIATKYDAMVSSFECMQTTLNYSPRMDV